MPDASPLPAVEVVGDVRAAVERAGLRVAGGGLLVAAGPVAERVEAARRAVSDGRDVFLAWPPGSVQDAEALADLAHESGVEVGVERPLGVPVVPGAARVVSLSLSARSPAWPRLVAGALDVCAAAVGARGAARVDAEAERDGAALRAVLASVRFRNGALASLLVQQADGADEAVLYASGTDTRWPLGSALGADRIGAEALAFVRAVAAGDGTPYALHDALATLRLAERVSAALR